jgi:hypothetical protein
MGAGYKKEEWRQSLHSPEMRCWSGVPRGEGEAQDGDINRHQHPGKGKGRKGPAHCPHWYRPRLSRISVGLRIRSGPRRFVRLQYAGPGPGKHGPSGDISLPIRTGYLPHQ